MSRDSPDREEYDENKYHGEMKKCYGENKENKMKEDRLKFNRWSRERIAQGRKFCTTRTRIYKDSRVVVVIPMILRNVRDLFWQMEGADSPEEFEKIWRGIFRGKFDPDRGVFTHIGDFREV